MAEETAKFGSLAWFGAWAERLANAGLTAVTNTLTTAKTAVAPKSAATNSPGGVVGILAGLTWLPYALAGFAVLILVLVFRKK